jgi:hypothetical protein
VLSPKYWNIAFLITVIITSPLLSINFNMDFSRVNERTAQLLEVYHDILDSVASGNEVDVIYHDLSKAFDKVPHNLLLLKLKHRGINGSLLSWLGSYLTDRYQRVALDGSFSDWLPVMSGVTTKFYTRSIVVCFIRQ